MKSKLLIIIIAVLVLIVVGVGLSVFIRTSEPVRLAPAWQLTPKGMYAADTILDPWMSWSPDSKSLVVAASSKTYKSWLLLWKAGEKRLARIGTGVSPNFTRNDSFLYFVPEAFAVKERNLASGKERVVCDNFRQVPFWKEITSFSYLPENKTIALRFARFTRYPESPREEVDFAGKPIGKLPRVTGDGVLQRSTGPTDAEIRGELTGSMQALVVGGKEIARGNLGSVAWSPDGKTLAYADSSDIKTIDPSGGKATVVARFDSTAQAVQAPYVCRLEWSPDSRYLAALHIVPTQTGADMMVYVLDMHGLKN